MNTIKNFGLAMILSGFAIGTAQAEEAFIRVCERVKTAAIANHHIPLSATVAEKGGTSVYLANNPVDLSGRNEYSNQIRVVKVYRTGSDTPLLSSGVIIDIDGDCMPDLVFRDGHPSSKLTMENVLLYNEAIRQIGSSL